MADYVQWQYIQIGGPQTNVSERVAGEMSKMGFPVSKGLLGQHRTNVIHVLNFMGDQGWEVVAAHSNEGAMTYILKRQRLSGGVQDTVQGF